MFMMVLVAFFVSVLGVANTRLMTIEERRKELAYLKCVGAGAPDIVGLVSLETLIMCTAGSVLGLAGAAAAIPWFEGLLREYMVTYVPTTRIVRMELPVMALSALTVIVVGMLASLYPAAKAARIRPMEVMRDE
jgi:ABC-type antimicrobial peptide transport system permease subunit